MTFVSILRRVYVGGLLSLLLWGCGGPRWISAPYKPSKACDPSTHIDANDPRWRESLGGLGFAWGCLSVRWSDDPKEVQGLPIRLEKGGQVFGYEASSGQFLASPIFLPSAKRANERHFQLHIFPPGTLNQDDPDRLKKHQAFCDMMKVSDYDCFASKESSRCWFVLRFSLNTDGAPAAACAFDAGKSTCESQPDFGKACSTKKGACEFTGKWVCSPDQKNIVCDAKVGDLGTAEICDGKDDNCDGQIDEDIPKRACYDGPDESNKFGACRTGLQACSAGKWGACIGQVNPKVEVCNNADDDCDGTIDDDLERDCYTGPSGTNNVGSCVAGMEVCKAGKWGKCVGEVSPTTEDCNGKDDNCNGLIDDKCTSSLIIASGVIDPATGTIDGKASPYWDKTARMFKFPNLRIPTGKTLTASSGGFLRIEVAGPVEILGTLDISGLAGENTNCNSVGFGDGGKSRGGGHFGGPGAFCDPTMMTQPTGGNGVGTTGGDHGVSESKREQDFVIAVAGAGGGGGHSAAGTDGGGTDGGKGGGQTGPPSIVSLGGGGGGGGCAIGFQTRRGAITFQPGAGGGGAAGVVLLYATGTITISGAILAGGGDGGTSATCTSTVSQTTVTGGGGGGGAGGHIRLRSSKEIILTASARLTATGGSGGGPASSKGGDGGVGFIQMEDADGVVAPNGSMVVPPAQVTKVTP